MDICQMFSSSLSVCPCIHILFIRPFILPYTQLLLVFVIIIHFQKKVPRNFKWSQKNIQIINEIYQKNQNNVINQKLSDVEEDVHNWFLHYLLDLLLDGCSDNTTKQYGYNPNPFGDIEIYRDTEDPLIWLCTHYILHEKSNDGQPYGSIFSIFSFSS